MHKARHFWASLLLQVLCAVTHAAGDGSAQRVEVREFVVIGNSLLDARQISALTAQRGGRLVLQEIQQVAQDLQLAYRNAGYGAVVVLLPEQDISRGVVRLQVVEGRLSQVQVAGNTQFERTNILASLPALEIHQTPRLHDLDMQLLMANENPAKSVRVVFQPGENTAEVEALAIVEESDIERWSVSLDDTGNDSTGLYRLGVSYQHANIADRDRVASFRYVTSPSNPGQVSIAAGSYRVPLYGAGAFLEFSALTSNTKNSPNQTSAGQLEFSGEGVSVGVRVIKLLPMLGVFKHQFSVGLENRRYHNNCSIGSLGSTGCGSAVGTVEVLPMTLGYIVQRPGVMQLAIQGIANVPYSSEAPTQFDAARPGASPNYTILRANGYGIHSFNQRWTVSWRADAQWSGQALVSAEQVGIGGSNSVRGYPERALSGDSGASASFEFRTPLASWVNRADTALLPVVAAFVDIGTVRNQQETACDSGRTQCDARSWGMGLLWKPNDKASVRLDIATPLASTSGVQQGKVRTHFSINYLF